MLDLVGLHRDELLEGSSREPDLEKMKGLFDVATRGL